MSYEIGQVFEGSYPPGAAVWCNNYNTNTNREYNVVLESIVVDNVITGYIIKDNPLIYPTPLEASLTKKQEAMVAFDKASESIVPLYSDKEVATFYKQEKEAIDWYKGTQAGTVYTVDDLLILYPFLYSLSVSRYPAIDPIEAFNGLATKVLEKAAQIALVNGSVLGAKQNVEDVVDELLANNSTYLDILNVNTLSIFNIRVEPFGFQFNDEYQIIPITTESEPEEPVVSDPVISEGNGPAAGTADGLTGGDLLGGLDRLDGLDEAYPDVPGPADPDNPYDDGLTLPEDEVPL